MPKIQFITPDGATHDFELIGERATIGRADDNDFVLPDSSVSSHHGEIHRRGDSIEIVDLGSTNGTHVANERVERATIAPGGTFKLGSIEGSVLAEGAAPGAPAASEAPAEAEAPAEGGEAAPVEAAGVPAESGAEEPAPEPSWGGLPAGGAAVITGLGATPCPVRQRTGFGPKEKVSDKTASLLMTLGVVSLLVCGAAAFLISKMGA